MLKHLIFGALSLFLAVVPARADLHYTLHTEARQVTPAEPVNPMLAMAGDIIVRAMLPDGAADSIYWISDRGTRVELTNATAVMPAGSVLLTGTGLVPGGDYTLLPGHRVEITIDVKPDEMLISVDGQQRHRIQVDFSKVDQPVSIFPAVGSTIRVKSVRVVQAK